MGNSIVISVYAKNSDPENSTFEASQTMVSHNGVKARSVQNRVCNLLYLGHCGWSYYYSHPLYHNLCLLLSSVVFCILSSSVLRAFGSPALFR